VTETIAPRTVPGGTATRAKLAAWPVPSASATIASGRPISERSQVWRTSATVSRSSPARRRMVALSTCGIRAAGVRGRGE